MKRKSILAIALSVCMLLAMSMTACGGGTGGAGGKGKHYVYNVPSDSKLTIRVKNFGMGPGTEWLEETAERFAELNQNTAYGSKTGVYIRIDVTNQQNTAAMATDSTNIFFDERASDPYSLAQNGLLLDLDDIVKDGTREGGSLESNIFDAAKGGIKGNDGHYYALPHYEFYPGIVYNRTTFDSLAAYFAADDEDNVYVHNSKYGKANFIGDLSAKKSVGPDGKPNTEDDGLPRSLDEFIILCDYIKTESDNKISPLTVTGKYYTYYPDYLLMGLWSSIAGAEQMRNYYNCVGEIEVVERDGNGNLQYESENLFEGIPYVKKPKTKMVTMAQDGSDGWMGNDMAAKYYALAMWDVIQNEGFLSASARSEKDHWQTQMDLFMDGKVNSNNSAMLVEGSYWYNEAAENGGFTYYERYVGKKSSELDVAWMSLPTSVYAADAQGRDACFLDCGLAYALVNGNIKNDAVLKQACLDFIAYCYSEKELVNFTLKTGITRAIHYTLDDAQKSGLSIYARRLWEARDNQNGSNVVAWSGDTDIFKKAKNQIKLSLDCGVLGDGSTKASSLFSGGKHASDVFAACSLHNAWPY